MKHIMTTLGTVMAVTTPAVAFGGPESEGTGILVPLFLGFGVLVIICQLIPALVLSAQAAFAQAPASTDPSASKSRAEVKAEERATGALGTKNIEVPSTPSTKGSGTPRAAVKGETRATGTPVTGNIEVPPVPSTKGSGLARSEVKAAERASGSMGTKNIEVPPTPGGRPPKAKTEKEKAAK